MKKMSMNAIVVIQTSFLLFALSSCDNSVNYAANKAETDSLRNQVKTLVAGNEIAALNLKTFDTLDYHVFTNQDWARLHESHSKDVKVIWPDGHFTIGIDKHIEDLKAMFVYAPDTRILQHPIRFGNCTGEWTCVTGIMEGIFTKPMPAGGGKVIQPTGKKFRISMCTVSHWTNGIMDEEYLFWDNQTYMKQLGLEK